MKNLNKLSVALMLALGTTFAMTSCGEATEEATATEEAAAPRSCSRSLLEEVARRSCSKKLLILLLLAKVVKKQKLLAKVEKVLKKLLKKLLLRKLHTKKYLDIFEKAVLKERLFLCFFIFGDCVRLPYNRIY